MLLYRRGNGENALPLYHLTAGLGTPVALQASLTVCPSSAVQFARISSKSGAPIKADKNLKIMFESGSDRGEMY